MGLLSSILRNPDIPRVFADLRPTFPGVSAQMSLALSGRFFRELGAEAAVQGALGLRSMLSLSQNRVQIRGFPLSFPLHRTPKGYPLERPTLINLVEHQQEEKVPTLVSET